MMEYEPGSLAKSLAGHDKGQLYIILKAVGEYVYLTDGNKRTVNHPKRKKKKHVQLQAPRDGGLSEGPGWTEPVSDAEIRKYLKCQKRLQQ